jgi:hypothetical protein
MSHISSLSVYLKRLVHGMDEASAEMEIVKGEGPYDFPLNFTRGLFEVYDQAYGFPYIKAEKFCGKSCAETGKRTNGRQDHAH